MILFLDFDGVLHHHNVVVDLDVDRRRIPHLRGPGTLFQHAPLLSDSLIPYPDVAIIVSSKWAYWFGLDYCRANLPPSLAARVVGATWEGSWAMPLGWVHLPRCEQVRLHVRRHEIEDWIALDDDGEGLSDTDADRDRFVICDSERGISDSAVMDALFDRLAGAA